MSINAQIHIEGILAVNDRKSLIREEWKVPLYDSIRQVVKANGHIPHAINGSEDHLHLVLGIHANQPLSDLMEEILLHSSNSINGLNIINGKFNWQDRYAAFSYSTCDVPALIKHIRNQNLYHTEKTFRDEISQIAKQRNSQAFRAFFKAIEP